MMIKRYIYSFLAITALSLSACVDDAVTYNKETETEVDDSELVETHLLLDVAAMEVSTELTRAEGESVQFSDEEKKGSDAERRIKNIWVFQFDNTSEKLLIKPRYYDISEKNAAPDETNATKVDVLLKPEHSIIYVVANTDSPEWADVSNSSTYEDVKKRTIPGPKYFAFSKEDKQDELLIPMEGGVVNVDPSNGEEITVKVTRMFAKVEIMAENIPESIVLSDVNVINIPYYCRVSTLTPSSEDDPADYPKNQDIWISRAFKPGERDVNGHYSQKLTLYIPENLQGKIENDLPEEKTAKANKKDALYVDFIANYVNIFTEEIKQEKRSYKVYPGANTTNDFNVRRNNIYRVRLNIYTDKYEEDTPSSNCFVVRTNRHFSFLPYYRTETGGGYDFKTYLDYEGDESKKINDSDNMLKNIKIIWQTEDAIGDNTNGDRVWIDRLDEVKNEFHRKIHVKTGDKSGNALIAAYNKQGEILWSWHIWVTDNDPGNISNAIVYSTYAWDENGIYPKVRVPGYAIMPCNLGALKLIPNDGNEDKIDPLTHGTLYQWGRKDPFPPSRSGNNKDYDSEHTGQHYSNDNKEEVSKTAAENGYLFHSLAGKNISTIAGSSNDEVIRYTIKNPTVFLCGTKEALSNSTFQEAYVNNFRNYMYEGDWLPNHDNKLWGGLDPDKTLKNYSGRSWHIYDNYGSEKSIFDPCPSGWRVPPGDLWLGFTSTGLNPKNYGEINTDTEEKGYNAYGAGMYMFMTDWKNGVTSFFPTQGPRVGDGRILRTGSCGNYHNATAEDGNRVNILHIHRDATIFNIFEVSNYMYHVKSVGGPIRCVRDHR